MKKILSLILLLLLLIPITLAEEIAENKTVSIGDEIIFAEKTLTIDNIGDQGTVVINFNDDQPKQTVSLTDGEKLINNINFKAFNFEIDENNKKYVTLQLKSEEVKITLNECNSDVDCNDNNLCTKDSCSGATKLCSNIISGCILDNKCYQEGSSEKINNAQKYCSGEQWINKKLISESCNKDYECENNKCTNNKCAGILIGEQQKVNVFNKITGSVIRTSTKGEEAKMHWVALIFGILLLLKGLIFAISPEGGKKLANFMLKGSDKLYRVLGIVVLIIGVVIIAVYFLT